MKTAQVRSLGKVLLPHMPGYTHKGRMFYAQPFNHILRAFYFEDSGFEPSSFYVWAFFMPLYDPTTHVYLNFGFRLAEGAGKRWSLDDSQLLDELMACIERDGLPFLAGVEKLGDVVAAIHRIGSSTNPRTLEASAYSLAMVDDAAAAQRALEHLAGVLDASLSYRTDRATQLARLLSSDPSQAKRQLIEWEKSTVKSLGI